MSAGESLRSGFDRTVEVMKAIDIDVGAYRLSLYGVVSAIVVAILLYIAVKLAMVELEPEHAVLMPAELSGGMVRRVALARALALEPELLLLDEPTAGLDPDLSAAFVRLILSLRQALGLTVVLITHDLDTIVAMATRIAVLADKRIISYASLDDTLQVEHPFIERFFGGAQGRRALARHRAED